MKGYYELIKQQYETERRIKELEITRDAGEEYISDLKLNTEFLLERAKNKLEGPFTMENITAQIEKVNVRLKNAGSPAKYKEIEQARLELEQFQCDLNNIDKMTSEIKDRKRQLAIAVHDLPLVQAKLETIRASLQSIYQDLSSLKFDQETFEKLFAYPGVEVVLDFFIKSNQGIVTSKAVKLAAGNCRTATLRMLDKGYYKYITQWEIQNAHFNNTRLEVIEMLQTIGLKTNGV